MVFVSTAIENRSVYSLLFSALSQQFSGCVRMLNSWILTLCAKP
jgi:hypothetical protein